MRADGAGDPRSAGRRRGRYGEVIVVNPGAGAELGRQQIPTLGRDERRGPRGERSDADVRNRCMPAVGVLERGRTCPEISRKRLKFEVDWSTAQDGFLSRQRENRRRVRDLAAGRDVLDGFCYTGGFALNALKGGARSVLAIDSSADALRLARANEGLNGLAGAEWVEGDVFQLLRKLRDSARNFDLVRARSTEIRADGGTRRKSRARLQGQ